VIPAPFEYKRASSLDEAVELLGTEDAKVLAGGHSLIPLLRLRFARPSLLVDVGRLHDLRYVREDGDRIAIGALTTHAQLVTDPLLREHCPAIVTTAAHIGDPQVRHRGTVGGSVAHGDPASDLATLFLTLDADFVVHGPEGARTVPSHEFFQGMFMTALGPQDVLSEIRVPAVTDATYVRFTRRSHDWATVGVAAARLDGRVQVGLTSMGATPLRASAVEDAFAGGASPADAAAHAAEGSEAPSDPNASSAYREHLARVLTERALAAVA
jgi:carbon-monoxide dehydrogenase medium subunit